jgi:hypothetical protein
MKWRHIIASLLVVSVFFGFAIGLYGSGSLTDSAPTRCMRITTKRMTVTTGTDGKASVASSYAIGAKILQVLLLPGSGAYEPNDGFDVEILDQYGRDILVGYGADLDNSVNKACVPKVSGEPIVVDGTLTVDVNNAGSGKTVTVVLMYEGT